MTPLFAALAGCGVASASASASELDGSGSASIDQRYRFTDLEAGPWYAPVGQQAGLERIRAKLGGDLRWRTGDWTSSAAGRIETLSGSTASGLVELSDPSLVMPVRLRVDELKIEMWDVGVAGLDLTLGHQTVQWGVGDQFNPTNTLNPNDLEDPLQFGMQLPNTMARADYAIGPMWTLSGVLVPVFRPAALPPTSQIGVAFVDRMPVIENDLRRELQLAQAFARDGTGTPTIVRDASVLLPNPTAEHMQGMVRIGGALGMQDVALSWYTGRSDMPQPVGNHTQRRDKDICHPEEPSNCINGYLLTDATMAYPRMHVAGFNGAGEIDPLGWLGAHPFGWRIEFAWVMPERMAISIANSELDLGDGLVQPAGEYDYGLGGERPTVVSGNPFPKWTLGVDYTIGKALYLNGQWVHGMVDEFGEGDFLTPGFVTRAGDADWEIRRLRIGDYLVLGSDLYLGTSTLRLFSLVDLTGYRKEVSENDSISIANYGPFSDEGFSAVVYPELITPVGDGLSVSAGAVFMLGRDYTKFGDPAAGGSVAFLKAQHRF